MITLHAGLQSNCASGVLYAIMGANAVGETFTRVRTIVRVTKTTGGATLFCSLAATDVTQTFAFVDSNTLVYFVGATTPTMSLLTVSSQTVGAACSLSPVSSYSAAAIPLFSGAPVSAVTPLGDGVNVLVTVGSKLFKVSRSGDVTFVGLMVDVVTGVTYTPSSIAFATPCTSVAQLQAFSQSAGSPSLSSPAIAVPTDANNEASTPSTGSDADTNTDTGSGDSGATDTSVLHDSPSSASSSTLSQSSGLNTGSVVVVAAVAVFGVVAAAVLLVVRRRRQSSQRTVAAGSKPVDIAALIGQRAPAMPQSEPLPTGVFIVSDANVKLPPTSQSLSSKGIERRVKRSTSSGHSGRSRRARRAVSGAPKHTAL
jgi:hypothetical protein